MKKWNIYEGMIVEVVECPPFECYSDYFVTKGVFRGWAGENVPIAIVDNLNGNTRYINMLSSSVVEIRQG